MAEESTETNKKPRKKRITKEELAKLLAYRKRLIKSKEKYFERVSKKALKEFTDCNQCDKCKFISRDCHKTCGVLMKWLDRTNKVERQASFGIGESRFTTADEFNDTTSIRLGVTEEVEEFEEREMNNFKDLDGNDIQICDINAYEVSEDGD